MKVFRCAIYTRKSTEEGLDKDFNSLDAQREACAAYITSQKHEGWRALATLYDDGGFSGGRLERPAMQRLLTDIAERKIDVVVVYKVDRLTRSLADFAKIVEVFDAKSVSFVSVTQQFNTTTSMGRLTLNVLLSFAQFEREVIAERVRDKITASKAKGMWMGGYAPLGYDIKDRKLIVNEDEAETVRHIFRRYVDLGAVRVLAIELEAQGLRSKRRTSETGRATGGRPFSRGQLYNLLKSSLYRGIVRYKGNDYAGQHEAIMTDDLWRPVQEQLVQNKAARTNLTGYGHPSLLAGLLFDHRGDRLTPTHAVKGGRRYRYYVSAKLLKGERGDRDGWRLPADTIEQSVVAAVTQFLADPLRVSNELARFGPDAKALGRLLDGAARLAAGIDIGQPTTLRAVLKQVILAQDSLSIELNPRRLAEFIGASAADIEMGLGSQPPDSITLRHRVRFIRRGLATKLIVQSPGAAALAADPALVQAVATGWAWSKELLSGKSTRQAIATREGSGADHVDKIALLGFLAPDIIHAILDGRQPPDMTLKHLTSSDRRRWLGRPSGKSGRADRSRVAVEPYGTKPAHCPVSTLRQRSSVLEWRDGEFSCEAGPQTSGHGLSG